MPLHQGMPYRVLYAFDPRRVALLLVGGAKGGDDRWYERFVPLADDLYDEHLEELKREGLMARKFKELRERMSPERRETTRERAAAMLLAMDLVGLRGKVELTQEELAERLAISQSNVSRLERRRDMLVSTLREVVEAMGGELHLVAEFPDGSVEITQFEDEEAA